MVDHDEKQLNNPENPIKLARLDTLLSIDLERDSSQDQGLRILAQYRASDARSYVVEMSPADAAILVHVLELCLKDVRSWDNVDGTIIKAINRYLKGKSPSEFPY